MTTSFGNDKLLVNFLEAAALLSVGRTTVFRLVRNGELSAVKIGSSSRITMDSIRALAARAQVSLGGGQA